MNRLPPEVLASCATFVSDNDPRPIVPLTHVCRYWRRSICSNPRNWASIATGWKRLTPLCLERAGVVPLTVDITVFDVRNDGDFLKPLLTHTSRIGRLRLFGHVSTEALINDLPGFFDSPMNNLTALELRQTAEPAELFPPSESPVPPVFQNLARLESLRLTRTPLHPILFNIPSLKDLELLGYGGLFDFGSFIRFLHSNLDLERVVLDIQFVSDSVETILTGKVPLSRLQHLSITCSKAIDSRGLLSCISLPRGVHIEVISIEPDPSAELGSFLPSPPTPIRELLAPITAIKTQLTPRELHLSGNGSAFTFRSPKNPLNAHGEFALFPTAPVRELYINIHPHTFTDVGLSKVMKRLPALEVLAISEAAVFPAGLASALTEQPVLCPVLRTIAFFDCDINPDIIRKLGEALAKRRDSTAAPVYRVVIVNSTGTLLDRTSIRQLRKSVPCVEVRVDDKLPDLS